MRAGKRVIFSPHEDAALNYVKKSGLKAAGHGMWGGVWEMAAASRDQDLFERKESRVRSYCRNYPIVLAFAEGATVVDDAGRRYIDFLAGAGALNYGHNHPVIKRKVIDYIESNGITHSLDLHTSAKHDFISAFDSIILSQRRLDYKMAFPGPTGTNAVEIALKFARRATGRQTVIAFTNAYHGMTQGALAISATRSKRAGAGMPLSGVFRAPFDGYMGIEVDTADLLEKLLDDPGSGLDEPAAIIIETVQAEGGLNVASVPWMKRIARLAHKHGAALILDEVQTGCGRTGSFLSFEQYGIHPDIVCLSKSLGGMGLPMSLVLVRPEFDVLAPGQHNGTFRGNNLAFVAATAALEMWKNPEFERSVSQKALMIRKRLETIVDRYPDAGANVRGLGMLIGIGWNDRSIAGRVSQEAFSCGLIIETSGAAGNVLKLLPPLTATESELGAGLDIIEASVKSVFHSRLQTVTHYELTADNASL